MFDDGLLEAGVAPSLDDGRIRLLVLVEETCSQSDVGEAVLWCSVKLVCVLAT